MIKTQAAIAFLALFLVSATAQADVTVSFGSGPNQFNMDFVTIGNPGNVADTTGEPDSVGSVEYVYNMGKFEVSRDMVTKANAVGGLAITLESMDSENVVPRPDMPATGVSWNEAARFVNWLNTSQGFQPAYKFTLQPGDVGYPPFDKSRAANILLWEPGDAGYDAANPFRNRLAKYFLPSADEWYKAAYYDPNANGGSGGYWDYPNGSDVPPTAVAHGTDPNTAVYCQLREQGPADIDDAGGLSPYGVMGLGGNVWEWDETELDLVNNDPFSAREWRGGFWPDCAAPTTALFASFRGYADPWDRSSTTGFRVASIPEPSTGILAAWGMVALMLRRRGLI